MAGKKTKGRQKIEMKKIENEDDKLITFSKRRAGIYKKASELVTLCGAEVGFVVFSPSGKPYSFAHPSIESVLNRFQGINPPPNDNTQTLVEAHRQLRINELNEQHNQISIQLEVEKEREKALKQLTKGKESQGWWDVPIEQLNVEQLEQLHSEYQGLYTSLVNTIKEKTANASSSSQPVVNPTQGLNPFTAHASASSSSQTTTNPMLGPNPFTSHAGASSSTQHAMNPSPGPYPFAPDTSDIDPTTFPPGYDFGSGQL